MKMGESQLNQGDLGENQDEREEKEVDYLPSEYADYFVQKEGSKKYQFRANDLVKMCHEGFKDQLKTGHAKISPVICSLFSNEKIYLK